MKGLWNWNSIRDWMISGVCAGVGILFACIICAAIRAGALNQQFLQCRHHHYVQTLAQTCTDPGTYLSCQAWAEDQATRECER